MTEAEHETEQSKRFQRLQELKETHIKRLHMLKIQQARMGVTTSPAVVIEIEDIRDQIARLETEIQRKKAEQFDREETISQLEHLRRLLASHKRRLSALEERRAHYGFDSPVHILVEIQDLQQRISETESEISLLRSRNPLLCAWQITASALEAASETFERAVNDLSIRLCEFLQLRRLSPCHQAQSRFSLTYIDASPVLDDVHISPTLPLVFLPKTQLNENDLPDLQSLMDNVGRIAVLILFGDDNALNATKALLSHKFCPVYAYDVVILGQHDIEKISLNTDPRLFFRRTLLAQVNLVAISPFVTTGPVPDDVFFGREQELRKIASHLDRASFGVIGGRRIGKSSILSRLHRVRLPAAGFCTLYHDCSSSPTCDSFLAVAIHDWRPESPPNAPATFGDLLQSPPTDRPLVLLLDEADKLVPTDRADGWRLFNALRALANSGRGQVVLSGERTLHAALKDPTSPLFNFANEIPLGPLDYRAVEELVTRPMKQLEIELSDETAMVRRIWDFTSGHPNVVQRLCRRLIERLNEQGTRRLTLDDVDAVINDPGFQEDDFLKTYWERATPLEQIISLLMAQEAKSYRLQAVLDLLAAYDLQLEPEVVKAALDRLVDLRSILKRSQAGYEFAVEAFPLVIANTTTAEDLLIILKSQYVKNPMESAE